MADGSIDISDLPPPPTGSADQIAAAGSPVAAAPAAPDISDLPPPPAPYVQPKAPSMPTYTPWGKVPVDDTSAEPDPINKMLDHLSESNLVDGKERKVLKTYLESIAAPIEGAATTVTGMLAKPVADVAGLAATGYDLATGNKDGDPAGFQDEVARGLTYAPKTEAGRSTVKAIGEAGDATIGSAARFASNYYGGAADALHLPEGVSDAVRRGTEEGTQQALGFLGPHEVYATRPWARAAKAAAEDASKTAAEGESTSAKMLKVPDTEHEGSGAEPAPGEKAEAKVEDSAAPGASPAAGKQAGFVGTAPQDGFMMDLDKTSEPHPTDPDKRKVGNVSVKVTPDPTDPSAVHISHFEADEPGKGQGTAAMQQITDLADKHGVNVSLDARPLAGDAPIPQDKLDSFYSKHGFEPDEVGNGSMVRRQEPAAPGMEVQESAPDVPELKGDPNHPMRNDRPYTMISGELKGKSPEENDARHAAIGQMLQSTGMKVAPTIGAYEKVPERSYAVQAETPEQRAQIENIGRTFGQDSVLHVDANKDARLKFSDPGTPDAPLGKMTPVTQEEALQHVAWTRDADGNHYVAKEPGSSPNGQPVPEPINKNGLGDKPEEKQPESLFGGPAKSGSSEAEPTPAGQAERVATFKRVGLDEVRNSAINGDVRQAGTEFQTSKLKDNPAGDRLAGVIDKEHQALREHAEGLVDMSGGSKGLGQTEMYSRGQAIEAPVRELHEYLEDTMDKEYEAAKQKAQGKPFRTDEFAKAMADTPSFELTQEGSQLHKGLVLAAKRLGLMGEDSVFKPATVEQAEAMRKYINDAYNPRTAKLTGALKGALDADVMKIAGKDIYAKARGVRTLMSKMLEEPEGVSKLLQTKQANKLGINRAVDVEKIPSYVTKMPFDQFRQYISVLKQAAQSGESKLAALAEKAHKEVRAQFANEYQAAGDNLKGQWNQKAANKYLHDNELAMRYVFTPEEMRGFVDNDNAGRWLSMDRSYPGAEAQKQNLATQAANLAAKGATHIGTGVGAAAGHFPGAIAGAAVGKVAGKLAEKVAARGAEQLITKVNDWKPESTGARPPAGPAGQRGSFSFQNDNALNRATSAPRNKQRGGTVTGVTERNPRSEYNANSQLAGKPKMTAEQENILARMGQGGRVGVQAKQSTAGARNKQRGGSIGKKAKPVESPETADIKQYLTDDERAQLRADTAARMVQQFKDLGPNFTHELAAAALHGEAKRGWYRKSAEAIANVFGPDAPRFTALLAAMSPQNSVEMNFHNAIRTFINWDKAGRPTDTYMQTNKDGSQTPRSKSIEQIMNDSVQKKGPDDPGSLYSWVPNAVRALTHSDPERLPAPRVPGEETMSFRHFSNAKGDTVKLDPSHYGEGVPGAEKKRVAAGAPKTISAYAADHPDAQVEPAVRQGRTEYAIHVPKSSMYDLSADPENIKEAARAQDIADGGIGNVDHSTVENMIKDKGYTGYHVPDGVGIMKGQARFFKPVDAVRKGSEAEAQSVPTLSGPKVNSFMQNLLNNVHEVTNDAWMANFANIDQKAFKGALNKSGPGKGPGYLSYSAHVRKAAAMLSHLTGEQWTPAEVQETVWSWAKTAYEHAAAHGKSVPDVVNNGEITDDLIRSTPDFHTLFSSPEHRGFLNNSRYAGNVERMVGGKGSGSDTANSSEKSQAAKKALRPFIVSAAKRLDSRLAAARASGEEAPF